MAASSYKRLLNQFSTKLWYADGEIIYLKPKEPKADDRPLVVSCGGGGVVAFSPRRAEDEAVSASNIAAPKSGINLRAW
jgi:hypothetical protein